MERESDVQLIQRILSGDEAAFSILVDKHQKGVHALAWRKVGDFHDAEEITQDTFLQVYKKLPTLKDPYKFAGWLYVIANRLCIDWIRKKNLAIQSLEDTPVEDIEKSSYTHHVLEQSEIASSEHRRELVKKLLAKLPESERTVMTLHYLGEMTVKEISKFLGVSVSAIHNRLYRARKRLQAQEESLVQEVLSSVQIPASVKQNIMRRAADINLTPPPTSKPLLPWVAFGTAVVLVALLIGVSNQHLIRFQRPYSFEAASEPTIEIVDTAIVLDIVSKPAARNQAGRATLTRKISGASTQVSDTGSTPNTLKNSRRQLSVMEKVQTRSLPSITGPWAEWFANKHHLSYAEMRASHDLLWSPEFGLRFQRTDEGVSLVGDWIAARRQQEVLLDLNPNMILLCEVNMRGADPESPFLKALYSGDDFPWVKDDSGEIMRGAPAAQYKNLLIDFTHPITQDIIVAQAIAVAKSGLWDGILFSYWNEKGVVLEDYRSYVAEQNARKSILQRIRDAVKDDFLIIVGGSGKLRFGTPYINGIILYSDREDFSNDQHAGLIKLERNLLWAEKNLREPRINYLQAKGIGSELPLSSINQQAMRCFTTLSLTHSDGYFLYTMGIDWGESHRHDDFYRNFPHKHTHSDYWNQHTHSHDTFPHAHGGAHYWYDFWDADVGHPIGKKGRLYPNREGLFIREFTNGWVVYNRSGKAQNIQLPEAATGVTSRITGTSHTVPDLDGEIYLK
ncbi:MAG: RNA polymerase sigma factor [Candidatus Poribacteria bacterium]|nr:RNA polymerase sigma factor [Candidatus Poribacteria bacterium]